MPVLVKVVADEMLAGSGVYDLDPATQLIASQAAVLLGRSKTRMDGDRRDNKPPPSYLDGRKVWYRLDAVLAERARIQGTTPEQARDAAKQRVRQGGWSFAGFVGAGRLDDTWPIAIVNGSPVDFFQTLGQPVDDDSIYDIEDMSLEHYLMIRLDAAKRSKAQEDAEALSAATKPTPYGDQACQRCGNRAHSGPCRL